MPSSRREIFGTLVTVFLVLVGATAAVAYWLGRTTVLVLNETECVLSTLRVELPGLDCAYSDVAPRASVVCEGRASGDGLLSVVYEGGACGERSLRTQEFANPALGWNGVLLLRADGSLGAAPLPR
ncbi:hypothetical protein JY651_49275 [Pyxidicoccus parkwayensis]|uniref:Lipoprotein n=1 Tax=Pyxidicoccus parkwayensis TaxID=2813578 RepID=A0ABX7NX41_9BACT|nr:hypothetical protein [Pyxidicoccus parkwaysis]QSQ23001.1 hypothetical protein JY651_49275 [Pyxidicoccus parkwaysis]